MIKPGWAVSVAISFYFSSQAVFAQGDFRPKVDYPTASNPISIYAADLDGDGDTDLVAANYVSNNISVLKNNGNGTFAAKVDYPVGTQPISVVAANLDTASGLDLAVANYGSNKVSILINNGNGTFADTVNYLTGTNPTSVFAARLDTDSYLDIVVANKFNNSVSVFKNNGDGTFATKNDFGTDIGPTSVFASKIGGDANLDLVVACSSSNSISVLTNDGTGTFGSRLDSTTGNSPRSVFVADLNGDGDNDVVTANKGSNTVSILKNDGNGTFAAKVDYGTGSGPFSVFAKNIDFDSDLDLVVANYNDSNVSVLKNNGNGTFAARVDYRTGTNPASVVVADFDLDGDQDLAVADYGSNHVSILLRNRPPVLNSIPPYSVKEGANLTFAIHASDPDTVQDSIVLSASALTNATFFDSGNGSGTFSFNPNFAQAGTHNVTFKASDGALTDSQIVSITVEQGDFADPISYSARSEPSSVAAADLDGDGDPDLAATNFSRNSVSFLRNNGSGVFTLDGYFTGVGIKPVAIVAARLDTSHTRIDLAVANSDLSNNQITVLRNLSNLVNLDFSPVSYPTAGQPYSIFAAKMDTDEDIDLAVANLGDTRVGIYKNDGVGGFFSHNDYEVGHKSSSVFGSDFDGDGYIDLALTGSPILSESTVTVIFNNGNGIFSSPTDYLTGRSPNSVFAADLDADGDSDLVVANSDRNTVSILKNNGNGTFASKIDYPTGSSPVSVFVTQLIGNSAPDIAVANKGSGTVSVLRNKGDGTFFDKLDYLAGFLPSWIVASDVDKDGDKDLVVANQGDSSVSILFSFASPCNYKPGDVNADGSWNLTDIVGLVNIVFKNAAKPSPLCRTDCNGTGGNPSLADIVYLVNKVFKSGPNPVKIGVCCL